MHPEIDVTFSLMDLSGPYWPCVIVNYYWVFQFALPHFPSGPDMGCVWVRHSLS